MTVQVVAPNAVVFYEGNEYTGEGPYVVQGRVEEVAEDTVTVQPLTKFTKSHPAGVPCVGEHLKSFPVSYFEKPLSERLQDAKQFDEWFLNQLVEDLKVIVDDPEDWLDRPNPRLNDARPRELLGTDRQYLVRNLIESVKHGHFS